MNPTAGSAHSDSEPGPIGPATPPGDWRGWLALTWAVGFGLLYIGMVLDERAPGLWLAIARRIGR